MFDRSPNAHLIIFAFILALPLMADFSFEYDAGIRAGILPDGGFEVFLGGGHLENTGSTEDTYQLTLDLSDLPDGWSGNFCAGSMCYPTEAVISVLAGRNTEVSVHIFPDSPGAGTATFIISSSRAERTDTIMYWASMNPEILVINDGGRAEISQWYSNSLSSIGKIWGILNRGDVLLESLDMSRFSSLIWFTGPNYDDVFDEADTAFLNEYLSGGGKFILSSQGAAPFCETSGLSEWMETYLKAELIDSDSGFTAFYGLPGTVFDGISGALGCMGGPEEFDMPSAITPLSGAISLMEYEAVGDPIAAIGHYSDIGSKLVFFGFPLEAISFTEVRDSVISKALAYIDGAGSVQEYSPNPSQIAISAYPNPFNSSVKIDFSESAKKISIFDINGNLIEKLDLNGNSLIWNATNTFGEEVPAGIYFVKTDNENIPIGKVLFLK